MIKLIKRHLKNLLPVTADAPPQNSCSNNSRKYITLSLKRSGQHAVINWLCSQIQNVIHFNHCSFERRHLQNWITPINHRVIQYDGTKKIDSGIQDHEDMVDFLSGINHYEHLLYSFEDLDIENKILRKYIATNRPTVILILRDPYNCLASTLKRKNCDYTTLVDKKNVFIKYLNNALGSIESLDCPVVPINYNSWVTDPAYRESICRTLDMPFSTLADQSILEVPNFGGGSSFDGTTPRSTNEHSNVFQRWKEFESDPVYRKLLDDSELTSLSKSFFGIDNPL